MPHPEQQWQDAAKQVPSGLREMLAATKQDSLALEVAALRQDIAALREMLAPVPSLIATGRDVLEQFKKLSKGK